MSWWPFSRQPFDVAKRVVLWLVCGMVMVSGYGLTKLEPYALPQFLPLTVWDQAIPFLPWTIWFYGTATWMALIAWLQVPDKWAGRRLLFSVALAACLCWVFFAFFPTTYPRHLYPLPSVDSWTVREFADLRQADTPSNCFPSQHVALAWSLGLTWASFLTRWWARPLPILWAVVVTACTLTTKQHYIVDIPPGFLIGVFAWWVCHRGIQPGIDSFWERRGKSLSVSRASDVRAIAALRKRVEGHQWSLDDIDWPTERPALDPILVRLLNRVTYVEEIARLNFQLQRDATTDDDLGALYDLFAQEERRHADGLRRLLAIHGADTLPPGLGNALVLDQFDSLDPMSDADAILTTVATPVFETFLDAGTIPFLRNHPAIAHPAFEDFVDRVCRDEGAHMATNWIVVRELARRYPGWKGLRFLLNPNILRGIAAIPWMSLDVYALAYRHGYDFSTLLPAFKRLWRVHERHGELASFPLWWLFRLFVASGALATVTCIWMVRVGIMWVDLWVLVTQVTDRVATLLFGPELLERRLIPSPAASSPGGRSSSPAP
jgi:membrane-associated phospholipid phosphatase